MLIFKYCCFCFFIVVYTPLVYVCCFFPFSILYYLLLLLFLPVDYTILFNVTFGYTSLLFNVNVVSYCSIYSTIIFCYCCFLFLSLVYYLLLLLLLIVVCNLLLFFVAVVSNCCIYFFIFSLLLVLTSLLCYNLLPRTIPADTFTIIINSIPAQCTLLWIC